MFDRKKYMKEYQKEYSKEHTERQKRYAKSHPEKIEEIRRRGESKARGLGFNPWNKPFKGCAMHHLNNEDVIFIPIEMHDNIYHRLVTGRGMDEINALATEYLYETFI